MFFVAKFNFTVYNVGVEVNGSSCTFFYFLLSNKISLLPLQVFVIPRLDRVSSTASSLHSAWINGVSQQQNAEFGQ